MVNDKQENRPVLTRVPANHGWAWLLQALVLIRSQAARLLFLAVLMQLIIGLTQVPVLGMLVVLAMPGLSAGMLEAIRRVASGLPIPASLLFVPLTVRPANARLLMLGLLMFGVAAASVMLIMSGGAGELDAELLRRIEQGDAEAIQQLDPELVYRVVMSVLLAVGLSGTISFMAIPLIWFHNMPTLAALVEGLKALAANWKPFLVLGLGLVAVLFPLGLVFLLLVQLAGTAGPMSFIFAALIMLAALAYQLLIFATQYCAVRDIYGLGELDTPVVEAGDASVNRKNDDEDDGQFLA
jgi:hypothetical protein